MDPQLISLAVIAVLFLPFILAGYYFYAAFELARPWFPQPLQEETRARFAFNSLIWSGAVPDAARRNYVRSCAFGCVAFAVLTLFLFAQFSGGNAPLLPVLLFASMTVLLVVLTLRLWLRYRRQLSGSAHSP